MPAWGWWLIVLWLPAGYFAFGFFKAGALEWLRSRDPYAYPPPAGEKEFEYDNWTRAWAFLAFGILSLAIQLIVGFLRKPAGWPFCWWDIRALSP